MPKIIIKYFVSFRYIVPVCSLKHAFDYLSLSYQVSRSYKFKFKPQTFMSAAYCVNGDSGIRTHDLLNSIQAPSRYAGCAPPQTIFLYVRNTYSAVKSYFKCVITYDTLVIDVSSVMLSIPFRNCCISRFHSISS